MMQMNFGVIRTAFALVLVCGIGSSTFAGKYNRTLDVGKAVPAWKELPGVDDKRHSLGDLKNKDVVVVVFTCNSCPYATDYEDRMIAFAQKHCVAKDARVALVAINVNKVEEDLPPAMKKRATEKKFPFPYLFDETQNIATEYGATWTPEFFVINKERKLVYMGAFDDNTDPKKVTKEFVEKAVAAALAGGEPEVTETPAIGCRIRMERRRRRRKPE